MAATTRSFRQRSSVAATSGRRTLARVVGAIASIVTLVLMVGIVLVLLKANQSNELVAAIRDAAAWLAGPFDQMFTLEQRRTETAVNWGVAAAVWFLAGQLLARVISPR